MITPARRPLVMAPGDRARVSGGRGQRRHLAAAPLSLTLLCLAIGAGPRAFAQGSAECATAECARAENPVTAAIPAALLQDIASADRLRLQFVDALRAFTIGQAGLLGAAGTVVPQLVADMDRARQEWDAALAVMHTRAARAVPSVDLDMALASRDLGRLAIDHALVHLGAAARGEDRRSDVHVARALALARSNRQSQALNALLQARTLAPGDPAILYLLRQQWLALNGTAEAGEALRAFSRAAARAGRNSPPRLERLELVRETAGAAPIFPMARYAPGIGMLVDGRLADAVDELRRAAAGERSEDEDLATTVAMAGESIGAGQLTAAIDRLGDAVTRWPASGELQRLLGLAHWVAGQQGEAIARLRQARDRQPADERARIALADVFLAGGRVAEAERELGDTLVALPASGQARYRLAQLRLDTGNLPGAVAALRDVMQLSPPIVGRDHVLSLLGSTLVKMADFPGAVAAYVQRVAVNPNSATVHRQLAEVYFLQGHHDEALGEFTAAVWLDSGDARAHAGLAQVLVRTDRYAEAADAAAAALAIDPALPEARFTLGTALVRLGRSDEGRAQLTQFQAQQAAAQERGRREFEIDALRREAARHVNAPAEAVPVLERVLELDPDSARSHRDLGLALIRGNDADRGRDHLERAQQIEPTADIARRLADLYRRSNVPEASARHQAEYDRLQQAEITSRLKTVTGR